MNAYHVRRHFWNTIRAISGASFWGNTYRDVVCLHVFLFQPDGTRTSRLPSQRMPLSLLGSSMITQRALFSEAITTLLRFVGRRWSCEGESPPGVSEHVRELFANMFEYACPRGDLHWMKRGQPPRSKVPLFNKALCLQSGVWCNLGLVGLDILFHYIIHLLLLPHSKWVSAGFYKSLSCIK